MNYNRFLIVVLLFIVIVLIPAGATTTELIWSKSLGSPVNTIDTSETGSIVFAGLTNGTILSYNSGGDLLWQLDLNGSITKLKTISDGSRLVAKNNINQSYWIDGTNGAVIRTIFNTSMSANVSDIDISRDGQYFAVVGNSSIVIYDYLGRPYVSNYTFPKQNWSLAALDPFMNWIVVTNGINKTFKWNITSYVGWPEMNRYNGNERNQSNIINDNFTYKLLCNITYPYTNTSLIFVKNTSIKSYPYIVQIDNYYQFNKSTAFNLSIRDNATLVDVIERSNNKYAQSDLMTNYTIYSGYPEINIYYGDPSYKSLVYPVIL